MTSPSPNPDLRVTSGQPGRRATLWGLLALVCLAGLSATTVPAADDSGAKSVATIGDDSAKSEGKPQGRLIRLSLPITGSADQRAKQMILRALSTMSADGPRVLVLELAPGATEAGQGSAVSRAMEIARFLTSQQLDDIKTVAYIPRSIQGHAVLVAMACDEIVMKADAEIGSAGVDEPSDQAIEPPVLGNYREIASRRRTIPLAVALGMLDRDLEVIKVETEVSIEYVLKQDLEDLEKTRIVESAEVLIPHGQMGNFTGRAAREMRFAKYLAKDRSSLARAYGLSADALRDDPSLGGDWKPIQIRLDRSIDPLTASSLKKTIAKQLAAGEVNFVLVQIDSPGGSLQDSMALANYLADIDPGRVRTVAYVTGQARAEAALVALGCQQLFMRPEATLGGEGSDLLDAETNRAVREAVRQWPMVAENERSWSLTAATLDPELTVFRYEHRTSGEVQYFSEEELADQDSPDDWRQGEVVTADARPLEVDGRRAKQLGLAWATVEDFEQLKQHFGLEVDPRVVQPGWADMMVEVLASPGMAALLLFIAFIGLYAEFQMPGIGIGGFVACVAFLLFFWSKFTVQTATWLEIILFLGGLTFLLLEIFVLPGFGVFGLGGGLMIIASLVLASQTFVFPQTNAELGDLRRSVMVVCVAAMGMIAASVMMRRYLPHSPVFNRMMLNPLDAEELAEQVQREAVVDYQHLLGHEGVTTTTLTPAGKATVDQELLDVISDGEAIERGTPIVVVEVHGNRVIVQAREA